ncbi:MAG: CDP-alcohol phosphatidyltransferase family protein [Alistipes sp.]|nr:CDP-alcohol phosphatidyltransferase family protein [Alistipes sp.]
MKIRLFTIPNFITLANLVCGAMAAVAVLRDGNLTLAFYLVVAAAIFDFFDGMVARLLKQSGPLGVQLDSLADDISFGLVPALVLFALFGRYNQGALPEWVGYTTFVVAAFAALRLAKFNIDDTQHTEFEGLPTPAATLLVTSLGVLADEFQLVLPAWSVVVIAVLVAVMMVAPVRLFALKFKGFGWKGNELRYSFIALSAVLLVVLRLYAVPLVIVLYVVLSLGRNMVCKKH